ncbi:extracellular solute-binding protein [Paenibacillus sp. HB172176]|uniref:extracellular solute-binding protein n=1 Tax=Paenibacillus sp. HB172176 TaxID=2493690 RepID=UPI00143A1B7F|nr:extracellular solute-binding protein [Paenibacillus sp. HB172176]
MKTNRFKPSWLKLTTVLALSTALIAGCSSGNNGNNGENASNKPGSSESASPSNGDSQAEAISLSYWVGLPANAARSLKDYGESLFYKELEKRTNVSVDFIHPAVGTESEQFNLMIASGKLPDVIESNFTSYPGGPEKAIADKVIIPLNDVIEQYAPNLKEFLDEHPDMLKEISTDNGTIYAFPALGVGHSNVSSGFMLRKDWLDELGLAVPETIDEWTNVLRAFKEKKGVKTPLTMTLSDFRSERLNGAYGVGASFYQEEGKVKFGPYEDAYKDYLALLNSWYKEGLLDPDFATQDSAAKDAKATNGGAGAFPAYIGSAMGKYLNANKDSDPAYDLVAAQHPVLNKGDEPKFFTAAYDYRGEGSAGITPANTHVEQTAKWLDYLYSAEGDLLKSFGVEGETYNLEGDYPKYTDLIVNNPDGLSIGDAMAKYLRVSSPSPGFVGDDRYTEQYYGFDQQKNAVKVFNKYYDNLKDTRMPRVTATDEEGQELSAIMAEVNTYREEMFMQFVMGSAPLSEFDSYKEQLKKMGIERAIEINQAALDRYNQR